MAGSICGVKRMWENPNFSAADFSDQGKHKMQKVSARRDFSVNPDLVSLGGSEYEAASGKSSAGSHDDDDGDGCSRNQFVGEFVLADPNLGKEVDGVWEESDEEEERDCEPSEETTVISCDDDGEGDGYSRDQFVGKFVLADPNLGKEVDGIWEESEEEEKGDYDPSEEAIVISDDDDDDDDDGYSRDQFVGKFVLTDPNCGKEDGIWEESDEEEERDYEHSEEAVAISYDDDGGDDVYSRDQFVGKFVLADPNLGKEVDGIQERDDDPSEEAIVISDDDDDGYSRDQFVGKFVLADRNLVKEDGIWEESDEEEERDYEPSEEAIAISYDDDDDDGGGGDGHSAGEQEFWGAESYGDDVYSTANFLADIVACKPKGQIFAKRDFPDGCHRSAAIKPTVDSDDDDEHYEEEESEEKKELECQDSEEQIEQGIGDDDDAVYSRANPLADIVANKPKGQIYAKRDFPDGCHQSPVIKPTLDSVDEDEYYEEEEEEEEELECQEEESEEKEEELECQEEESEEEIEQGIGDDDDDAVYSRANLLADIVANKPKGRIYAKRDFPDGCRQSAAIKPVLGSDDINEYYEEEEEELECQEKESEEEIGKGIGKLLFARRDFPEGCYPMSQSQSFTI